MIHLSTWREAACDPGLCNDVRLVRVLGEIEKRVVVQKVDADLGILDSLDLDVVQGVL